MNSFKELFPSNMQDQIKGDNGVILVIGGSQEYTGAPYFSSLSAFRTGADIVHILTHQNAMTPLKTLLPEAIITNIKYQEWIINRATACILGPGLGILDNDTLSEVIKIVEFLKKKNIPMVLDGDGLRLYNMAVFKGYKSLFLTPNTNELKKTVWIKSDHYIIEKGKVDMIRDKENTITVNIKGSERRCCGQGDILVGILSVLLTWSVKRKNSEMIKCGEYACKIIRIAAEKGYKKHGAGLMSSDIIKFIPEAMKLMIENEHL